MAVYRTLQPALTLAGRDTRVPDGSKPRLAAHKAAVATVKALVLDAPATTHAATVMTTAAITIAEDEELPPAAATGSAAAAAAATTTGDGGVWPVAYVCVLGALQRMTVMVPDKAAPRATVLASIVALLGVLARYPD